MRWLYTFPLRLRSLFRRSRVEDDLNDEIRFHLERQTEELVAQGLSPDEARYAALRAMGGVEQRKEECRDVRRVRPIENLVHDLLYALRVMRRSPGFTIVALLSLALGIGANATMFQLLDAIGLRSLPVSKPHELADVRVAGGRNGFGLSNDSNSQMTNPLWEQVREHQQAFSGVFAWGSTQFLVGRGAEARVVNGLWVSGDLFPVLGVRPARGRLFAAEDDRRGCGAQSAIVSDKFWRAELGADPAVVGSTLPILGQPATIIGVTAPEFFGLEVGRNFDVALPICSAASWGSVLDQRHVFWLTVMGRLKPDWTLARAAEHMNALSQGVFDATVPPGYSASSTATYRSFKLTAVTAERGVSNWRTRYERALWLLLATTGLVLLIGCVNISNLMVARAVAREHELAVRVAMGASRARLVAQTLTESLLLAVCGAALGTILAGVMSRGLVSLLSTPGDPLVVDLTRDWRVFTFTASVAVVTCLAFGLLPAIRSSLIEPRAAMQAVGRGSPSARRVSLQRAMVIGQVAVSLVLLVGALLFVRSFRNLTTVDTGLRKDGVVVVWLAPSSGPRRSAAQILAFEDALLQNVRSIPGVEAAAATTQVPLNGASWTQGFRIPGVDGDEPRSSKFTYVSPAYFATFDIPMIGGRDFNAFDSTTSPGVAVVNETFVRRYSPASNPLGMRVRTTPEPGYPEALYEIVGIVKDSKYSNLREEIPPVAFVPLTQHPSLRPFPALVVHTSVTPSDVIAEVKRRVVALDPGVTMRLGVFETELRERLARERAMAWLAGGFGVLATLLATIGLDGVIAYATARRRHEIGIRRALGASRGDILRLILVEASITVAAGVALGMGSAHAAVGSAGALLFGLSPHDTTTFVAAACLLSVVAGIASAVPAVRALRVGPMTALRCD